MSEERKTLLESLKDQINFFRERKTIGRMKTEHAIFIPSALMVNQAEETKEFIIAARTINQTIEWQCPVSAEQLTMVKISGVEFVFQFNPNTNFDAILGYLDSKINE